MVHLKTKHNNYGDEYYYIILLKNEDPPDWMSSSTDCMASFTIGKGWLKTYNLFQVAKG